MLQIGQKSKKSPWRHNFLTWRHRQFFWCCFVLPVKFSYWSKLHVDMIASSSVMTIFIYMGLTRNTRVLPNIWRLRQVRDTRFNTNKNVTVSLIKCYWMLHNIRVTAFTVSELLRKKAFEDLQSLKLVSAIFIKFLFFHQMISLQNHEKYFLFHLKSYFHSRDIQIFVFLFFPLFQPVGHCFRGWSKINLKVHDVINCLNKNSITHFVEIFWEGKRYYKETLSIDGVSDKKHFYRKIIQKICSKS